MRSVSLIVLRGVEPTLRAPRARKSGLVGLIVHQELRERVSMSHGIRPQQVGVISVVLFPPKHVELGLAAKISHDRVASVI
jgi:hypothetical protein